MNWQFSKCGWSVATAIALAASMMGAAAAQVASHTQLSVEQDSPLRLTAHVAGVTGAPAEDGIVSFLTAKGSVGSASVKDGEATLVVDKLPQSVRTITAVYGGSTRFGASQASAAAAADATSLPDFVLTVNPSSVTVSPGQYGTIVVTATPENGFANMITLTCSSIPADSACAFSPISITPQNGNAVTSTLQIQTQGASGTSAASHSPFTASRIAYGFVLPGALALIGIGALRRRTGWNALRMVGLAALLAASTLGLSACAL
jgi:hypothetical protein